MSYRRPNPYLLKDQTEVKYVLGQLDPADDALDQLTTFLGMLYSGISGAEIWMQQDYGDEQVPHRYTADAHRSVARIDRELRNLERILICWRAEVESSRR